MRPFTENLLPCAATRGWGIRSAGIVCLVWFALATPARADDQSNPPSLAALPPPNLHLDTTTALPHPLSAADADRYRAIFRLQQRGDWQGADQLIGRLGDTRVLGHVLAQRYLHPTYRSAYPELRDWLVSYADLPEAQQIYRLANARMQKGDTPPREPTAILRRLGTPDSGGEPAEPNWDAGLAAWRVHSMSRAPPRYWNDELRAITNRVRKRDNSVMMSSVMPSLKYCCSGWPLMLVNGSTAIEGFVAGGASRSAAGPALSGAGRAAAVAPSASRPASSA